MQNNEKQSQNLCSEKSAGEISVLEQGQVKVNETVVDEVEEVFPLPQKEKMIIDEKNKKVCILGTPILDEILVLDHYPKEGESVYASEIHSIPGGTAPNAAYVLEKLGVPTTFVGPHGDDETGVMLINALAEVGVDTWQCFPIKGQTTKKVVVTLSPTGERTFLVHPGVNLDDGHPLNLQQILKHELVFIDALRPDIVEAINASKQKPITVTHLASWWRSHKAKQLISQVNYVIGSEVEIEKYEKELVELLNDSTKPLIAYFTTSRDGASSAVLSLPGKEPIKEIGFTTPVVDITGAEDAFVAGVLYSLARKVALPVALKFALLLSSHATTQIGCRSAFEVDEVNRTLLENARTLFNDSSTEN